MGRCLGRFQVQLKPVQLEWQYICASAGYLAMGCGRLWRQALDHRLTRLSIHCAGFPECVCSVNFALSNNILLLSYVPLSGGTANCETFLVPRLSDSFPNLGPELF